MVGEELPDRDLVLLSGGCVPTVCVRNALATPSRSLKLITKAGFPSPRQRSSGRCFQIELSEKGLRWPGKHRDGPAGTSARVPVGETGVCFPSGKSGQSEINDGKPSSEMAILLRYFNTDWSNFHQAQILAVRRFGWWFRGTNLSPSLHHKSPDLTR